MNRLRPDRSLTPVPPLPKREEYGTPSLRVNGYRNPRKYGAAFFSGTENALVGW